MAIQTMHDKGDNYLISPKLDGGLYSTIIADCVAKGIGDEFALHTTANSLDVQFYAGSLCAIGGAFFKVTETETVTLDPNTTTYLCANIDLTRSAGDTGRFVLRTSSNMESGNLNGSGTSRDLLLYIIATNSTGIASMQDKRVIKGDGLSIGSVSIQVITKANYNSLSVKDPNTLYFIY